MQIKAPTKRRSRSDDDEGSWHEVQASNLFPPRTYGFSGRTPKRSCRSSDEDDEDDSLPSRYVEFLVAHVMTCNLMYSNGACMKAVTAFGQHEYDKTNEMTNQAGIASSFVRT